jgi:hypothetical protein
MILFFLSSNLGTVDPPKILAQTLITLWFQVNGTFCRTVLWITEMYRLSELVVEPSTWRQEAIVVLSYLLVLYNLNI